MKIAAGLVAGLLFAIVGSFLVTATLAAGAKSGALGTAAFLVLWAIALVIAIASPTGPKAWRRLLITTGVMSLLLPFAGMIFTGSYIASRVDPNAAHAGAEAAGAAIGGTLITGALGFVGFFLGVALLVIGLLVGRDKQIGYVQAPPMAAK